MTDSLLSRLGIELPIIQAPMAAIAPPAMAAAVANEGALGSIAVGHIDAVQARKMIAETRALTERPFNVNVFIHRPAVADAAIERAWIERLRADFARYGAEPPKRLTTIYKSFAEDDDMLAAFLDERPKVVSVHFGVPSAERMRALKGAGITLFGSATNLAEAEALQAAGIDAVVAQGYEAGGHRGMFDPQAEDSRLGTLALTRILSRSLHIPVIAAGGIMDGAGIAAALNLGAEAAQLGTAFIACPESAADQGYRAALMSEAAHHTAMTPAISGRPARSLGNRFTALGAAILPAEIPDYPIAYDAGKALHAAAKARGDFGYGAQWAGQGAPLARALPAGELVRLLAKELAESRSI
jgi:nitronate monooxygenase